MNKKIAMGLGALTAIAAPVATLVACNGGDGWKDPGGNTPESIADGNRKEDGTGSVAFITDGGSITDKSFNEGTLDGVKKWSNANANNTYSIYEVADDGSKTSAFTTAYNNAHTKNSSSTFVLPGFKHGNGNTYGNIHTWWNSNKGHKIIAIDIADSTQGDDFVGITFKTQQSGFMAAVKAGMQMNKILKDDKSMTKIKIGTFGGIKIPPVIAFMNGLAKGVDYFNANLAVSGSNLKKLELIHIDGDKTKDFSNSFTPGDGKPLANKFIDDGAQLIMASAGPQSGDVVEAIKEKKKQGKVFVIGIDVDQSQTYGGVVIGSAFKGLTAATDTMIANSVAATNFDDKEYTLADNNATHMYVGYKANSNYASDLTSAQETAANTAATASKAFASPLWTM